MQSIARSDILELSMYNPQVRACVEYWRLGYLTWEQAMMLAVVALMEINEILEKSAIQVIETRDYLSYD